MSAKNELRFWNQVVIFRSVLCFTSADVLKQRTKDKELYKSIIKEMKVQSNSGFIWLYTLFFYFIPHTRHFVVHIIQSLYATAVILCVATRCVYVWFTVSVRGCSYTLLSIFLELIKSRFDSFETTYRPWRNAIIVFFRA